MKEPIRVGILGLGRIVSRVMTDFGNAGGVRLTAIASRSAERAEKAAKQYGAPYAFFNYDELAECAEVDLVYIATPHPFHCEQAIRMMEHGKHVLCEKPMATTAEETRRMVECARKNGVFLMEAMWTRFMPAMKKLMELIRAGEIGEVSHIYSLFSCSCGVDPESRLFSPDLAGGALLDIGVYPLMAVTQILGWMPSRMQLLSCRTETQVDARMSIQMQYESGATAQIMTALDAAAPSQLMIYGTKGYVTAEDFWRLTEFTLVKNGGERVEYKFRPENEGHHYEFEEAARCIAGGEIESPLMMHEESIAVAQMTERLRHEAGVFYPWE